MHTISGKYMHFITQNIPFYSSYSNWEEIPIINKNIIRENYDKFVSLNINKQKRNEIINILNDNRLVCKNSYNELYNLDDLVFEETTGTSGYPLRVVKSVGERFELGKNLWKRRKIIDNLIDDRHFVLFNHTSLKMCNLDVYNYQEEHIFKIYDYIVERKARWLHTSIVPLLKHIEILKTNKKKYNFSYLKIIELTGNFVTEKQKKIVEEFFDAKVVNFYGSIEAWAIAYPCLDKHMHICDETVYLELVDENNHVIKENNKKGHIVITTLKNRVMPLIRYNIGDIGMYKGKTIGCGNEAQVLELEEGRQINYIKGLAEKKLGTKQFGNVLTYLKKSKDISGLRYIQFVQTGLNDFVIYLNYFDNVEDVLQEMSMIIFERLEKKVELKIVYLNQTDIEKKKYEKPNLFICKC